MRCDELVSLLEINGADANSLESVLTNGVIGAEFKLILASAGQHRRLFSCLPA